MTVGQNLPTFLGNLISPTFPPDGRSEGDPFASYLPDSVADVGTVRPVVASKTLEFR
jgi:hypothetical protein